MGQSDNITAEEVMAFIEDAKKARSDWLTVAEASWRELKKRNKKNQLWSISPNAVRARSRYPAWNSIFKIRQPLVLSRVGIPIGKDTTQDGNDNVGATAAICLERLAKNLARSFDFFDVMVSCRDDFLATNFSMVRAYYGADEIKEKVKEYIVPQKDELTGDVVFIGEAGKIIESDDIYQDDEGYFITHDKVVDVEEEKVCLEPVLYKSIYLDPDIRRYKQCKRMAFELEYSEPEFKELFGSQALIDLGRPEDQNPGADEASPKLRTIKVYEYWDLYANEVVWLPELGKNLLKPKKYALPTYAYEEEGDSDETRRGLYNLQGFFPVPPPLIMNSPTDEFWPVPEFAQLIEILEDIHTIFSRMVATTKAIRTRLLFDNSITGLQEALNEAANGDAFGVDNLAASLSGAGGTLEGVVQYIPVAPLIEALNQLYIALDQRLASLYRLTGTSDLLQGLSSDNSGKTLGERQIEEKYATNQLNEPQRKMAEFVRDSYELICEVALKNFKEASLDTYIMPQTMPEEHKPRYRAALEMLKQNRKRFRIELETDSTIALNEQYDKQMRIELVNALTTALEKTAQTAQTSPALVSVELHCLKYLVQGFRQGKLFQNEITQAIDNVIKQAEVAAQTATPPFNKDEVMARIKDAELKADAQIRMEEIASRERIELSKLTQAAQIEAINNQLEAFKAKIDEGEKAANLRLDYERLNNEIVLAQEDLALKRDELLVELRKVTDKKEVDAFKLALEERVAGYEAQLAAAQQSLEEQRGSLELQERFMTEQRLQAEHKLQEMESQIRMISMVKEASKPPVLGPITIQMPPAAAPVSSKKKIKIKRDGLDNISDLEILAEKEAAE